MIIAAKNTQTPKYEKTKNDLRHQALQPESDINVQWYENPVICNVYIRMYIYILYILLITKSFLGCMLTKNFKSLCWFNVDLWTLIHRWNLKLKLRWFWVDSKKQFCSYIMDAWKIKKFILTCILTVKRWPYFDVETTSVYHL